MTYKRSSKLGWLLVLFATAYIALMIYAAIPIDINPAFPGGKTVRLQQVSGGRLAAAAVGLGVVALGAVIIVRRARHPIVVEADGITDTAAYAERVPWKVVENVELTGAEETGYRLTLTVTGPPKAMMVVNIGGLDHSPSAVFGEVFDSWRAATGRTGKST